MDRWGERILTLVVVVDGNEQVGLCPLKEEALFRAGSRMIWHGSLRRSSLVAGLSGTAHPRTVLHPNVVQSDTDRHTIIVQHTDPPLFCLSSKFEVTGWAVIL